MGFPAKTISWQQLTEDVLQSAFDAILLLDDSGLVQFANEAAYQMLGYVAHQVVGKPIRNIIVEMGEVEEDLFEHTSLEHLIMRGMIKGHRFHFQGADGRHVPVLFSAARIRPTGEDSLGGVICTAKDLTEIVWIERNLEAERQQNEQRLVDLKEFAETVVRNVNDLFFVVSGDGEILRINNNVVKVLGYTEDAITHKPLLDVLYERKKAVRSPFDSWEQLFNSVKEHPLSEYDAWLRGKDRQEIPVSVSAASLKNTKGQFLGLVVSAKDARESRLIKELKQKQEQLVKAGKMAALGGLSGGMAHELNNPLAIIRGFTEIIHDRLHKSKDPAHEDLERYAAKILRATERMADVVRLFREFSGSGRASFQEVRVADLVNEAVQSMRSDLAIQNMDIDLVVNTTESTVEGDASRLQQVLIAILNNARDAVLAAKRPQGLIKIGLWNNEDTLTISISDNGTGIDAAHIPQIFDPFFTTRPVGHGMGLGLAIAHNTVTDHRGEIEVYSTSGEGTTFMVMMPLLQQKRPKGE